MSAEISEPIRNHDPTASNPDGLSDEMAALYDRQLRLWGVDVQNKLVKAHLLIIRCGAAMTEVAKNLVLAGIGKVTVCDEEGRIVEEHDQGREFILAMAENGGVGMKYADAVLPHLQSLSPYAKVGSVNVPSIRSITPEFLAPFDIILATDLPFPTICSLNDASRVAKKPFLSTYTLGPFGYAFADLGDYHEYVHRQPKALNDGGVRISSIPNLREIVNVEDESWAKSASKDDKNVSSEDEVVFQRVLTRDRYVPFNQAMLESLPADVVRRAVRQTKHTQAAGGKLGGQTTSVTSIATLFRALYLYEGKVMNGSPELSFSALYESSPARFEAFLPQVAIAHGLLGLPSSVPLPDRSVIDHFWQLYTTSGDRTKEGPKRSQLFAAQVIGTSSCLGGMMAEQIIALIGQREPVLQNWLIFDGNSFAAPAMAMIGQKEAGVSVTDVMDVRDDIEQVSKTVVPPVRPQFRDKGKDTVMALDDDDE